MGAVSLIGFGSFVLVSLVVGARLLLLAGRTRQLPEAAMGAALFLGGGLGYAAIVLALHVLPRAAAPWTLLAGNALVHLGSASLAIGTWLIFRPDARWPALAVAAVVALLAGSLALRGLHLHELPPPAVVFWSSTPTEALVFAWGGAESLHYWRRMRRRAALGLADPATARRFALWGIGSSCATAIFATSILGRVLTEEAMPALVVLVASPIGLVGAVCIALAFSPRLRGAAAADAAADRI